MDSGKSPIYIWRVLQYGRLRHCLQHWHPIPECGFRLSCSTSNALPVTLPGKAEDGQVTHMWDPEGTPGFWLWPGLAPVAVAFAGVTSKWKLSFSLSGSLILYLAFQENKFLKNIKTIFIHFGKCKTLPSVVCRNRWWEGLWTVPPFLRVLFLVLTNILEMHPKNKIRTLY